MSHGLYDSNHYLQEETFRKKTLKCSCRKHIIDTYYKCEFLLVTIAISVRAEPLRIVWVGSRYILNELFSYIIITLDYETVVPTTRPAYFKLDDPQAKYLPWSKSLSTKLWSSHTENSYPILLVRYVHSSIKKYTLLTFEETSSIIIAIMNLIMELKDHSWPDADYSFRGIPALKTRNSRVLCTRVIAGGPQHYPAFLFPFQMHVLELCKIMSTVPWELSIPLLSNYVTKEHLDFFYHHI